MKRVNTLLIAIALLLSSSNAMAQGQVYLYEGFEGSMTGWENKVISGIYLWRFENGGGYSIGNEDFRNPATAYAGTKNALYQVEGYDKSARLISPTMDLRYSTKPVLSFYLTQDEWNNTDELEVFYRVSPTSPQWFSLQKFTNTLIDWTYKEIVLPNEVKVEKCQISFVATSKYGWGICLDEILIDERGNVPRSVSSVKTYQAVDYLPTKTTLNPIAFVEVAVSGNTNNLYLTSANINYTGTSISDISACKLYYTRDSVFSNSNPAPLNAEFDGDIIRFKDGQQLLNTGLNYIWICADISATAIHGNRADISIPANSLTIGGNYFPSVIQDPSGYSTIEESIVAFTFESPGGWEMNSSWEIGVPTGVGHNDPLFAYAGTKVLATNLSGNYPANITEGTAHRATMNPAANAKYYQNINLRFKRWLNVESVDRGRIWLSADDGVTWTKLMENTITIQDNFWKNMSHNISNLATRKEKVKVRISIDESDATGLFGGWNIDNFAITGDFIAKDLGVSGITSPTQHCGMGSEPVTVIIKNYGGEPISTPFEVGFSIDNGVTYTKQLINPTIAIEGDYTHTFTATANLSTPGLKQLKFKTFLTGDEDSNNDTYSTSIYVYPSYNYAYSNSFETTNGFWYPSGANSSWAWGIPAATKIDTASNGTKAWVTNLKGNHNSTEVSYLESPCFNFELAEYPVFSFDYFINSELGVDGFRLEYSIDGGQNWLIVPENTNHTQNWCTGTSVSTLGSDGWTGESASNYVTAKTLLPISGPNRVTGLNNVKFRFKYSSDAINTKEGVAIDNIKIYELPYDVGVKRLVSPISGCYIGNNVKLTAKVTNHGYRPLKAGLKIPIDIKLRNENVVKDTLTVGSMVPSADSTTFITKGTFNIFNKGSHALRLNTNINQDLNRLNDTLKTTLQVRGVPDYSLGADKAVTVEQLALGVVLNAGQNGMVDYLNYSWESKPPLAPLTPPTDTKQITVDQFGFYISTVTNENSCTAKDTIEVVESTSDITITDPIGLSDACEYSTTVKPQISITNLGPNAVGPGSTVTKTIPLSIMVDGVVKVSEVFEPLANIAKDETVTYTFTNGLDLSLAKEYKIRIYSKINEDPDKNNDTLKVTTNVWGLPNINFPQDTIVSINATSIVLDAGTGFMEYSWSNSSVTTQTFNVPSLNSAWYYATVTAFHSCGTHTDSVYINAKDLSVISIQNPTPSFCDNENPTLSVVINNSGKDNFAQDEIITISYNTPEESVSKDFTLTTALNAGDSRTFSFDNPVKMPNGEGFINVTALIANDPTSSNNHIEKSFEKRLSPTVSFNPSTISRVFGSTPYYVSPIYSSDVRSYEWKDPYMTSIGYDSLYKIENSPPGRTLHVIAYEGLAQVGCKDTASLTIISDDMAIDAIKSPANKCELTSNTPVTITIANKGNFIYPSLTPYTVDIYVDGELTFTENKTLQGDFGAGAIRDITLTNTLNLLSKTTTTIQVNISTSADVVAANNTLNKTVYSTGYPSVNLGSNRTVYAYKDTLRTGGDYASYEWLFNGDSDGIDSVYIADKTGNYKVNVVDYNGCDGTSNEITLTFVVEDISLKTLDKPNTGCGLSLTEPVRVTVENTGSVAIASGKELTIEFRQIAPPNTTIATGTQNFTLSSNLAAEQTRTFDLTNTMSFPNNIEYSIKAWVKMTGDMRNINDTLFSTVRSYPAMLYNQFNVDTIEIVKADTTLDAGSGFSSYLWNTGATSQTLNINTSGQYWVEVTNTNNCKGKDSVYVKFLHDLSIESLVTPLAVNCALSTTQTITVSLKNEGNNIIPSGTSIPLTLKVASTLVATESFVLISNLAAGSSVNYTFTYKPNLATVGDYLLEISAKLKNDNSLSNNTKIYSVRTQGAPVPNLGLDRFISTPTVLNPGTFSSYLWHDNTTNPTFTANQTGTYSVTVTDGNGCTGYDEVVLTWQENVDVQATALVSPLASPLTNCYNSEGQTITITLKNLGSSTLTSGQTIDVSYQVNTNTPVVQTLTLTSDLATNQTRNFTFNQKAILDPQTYTLYFKTIINSVSGTSTNYPVIINANPVFAFSSDTIKTSLPYQLLSGISGVTYSWNTGSTNASIQVSTYGKYWLTVTSPTTGCSTTDTIVIANLTAVETIPGSNAKVTYFPNPVNNELSIKIETDKNESFTIDLINPSGQIVKNIKTDHTLFYSDKIDVKGFNSGLYLLKVGNGKGNAVFKVIVQH